MKTAVKISLAAAGILAVLGIAGLGVGMALGGGPSVFRGLSRLPGILRFTHGTPGSSIVSSEPYGEEMQDYQNVKNLTLDFSACELQIRTHEESFISLSASNTQDTFSCEQYDEDLILEDHREIFGDDAAAYPDQALRLTLLVPQETLDTLDISLDLGEIDAESLSADTVTVYCSLGSMKADSVSAGDLDLHFDLGDVDLDRLQVSRSASIDASCGDVDLGYYEGPDLNLNCAMGNASVLAGGREQDYNYELVCDLGQARLGGQHHGYHHGENHDPAGCHINQDNQAACHIYAYCALGNLDLNFSEEE